MSTTQSAKQWFQDIGISGKEWAIVPKKWWEMFNVIITVIPYITGIWLLWCYSQTAQPAMPKCILPLLIIGAVLFMFVSFFAFHRVRLERDSFKKSTMINDNDIKLKEWRKEYRKAQMPDVTQIPITLKAIWAFVDSTTKNKKTHIPNNDIMLAFIIDTFDMSADDLILKSDKFTSFQKVRKLTAKYAKKSGLNKHNTEKAIEIGKKIVRKMNEYGIGLSLNVSSEYNELIEQLKSHSQMISNTKIDYNIHSFVRDLNILNSIELLMAYGRVIEHLALFPKEMQDSLQEYADNVERAMRTSFVQLNNSLERYSIGDDQTFNE